MRRIKSTTTILFIIIVLCSGCGGHSEKNESDFSELKSNIEQGNYDGLDSYYINSFSMTCNSREEKAKLNVTLSDDKNSFEFSVNKEGNTFFKNIDYEDVSEVRASQFLTNLDYIRKVINENMSEDYDASVELVSNLPIKLDTNEKVINLINDFEKEEGIYLLAYNTVDTTEHIYIRID